MDDGSMETGEPYMESTIADQFKLRATRMRGDVSSTAQIFYRYLAREVLQEHDCRWRRARQERTKGLGYRAKVNQTVASVEPHVVSL
jgi:hypothetical protein